jgi:hypothetical protein
MALCGVLLSASLIKHRVTQGSIDHHILRICPNSVRVKRYYGDTMRFVLAVAVAITIDAIGAICSVLVEDNCDKIRNGEWKERPYTWNPVS